MTFIALRAIRSAGSLRTTCGRRPGISSAAIIRAGTAGAAFTAVAVIASWVTQPGPLAGADEAAFAAVRARRHPAGAKAAHALSALAEPELAYPIATLAGLSGVGRTNWRQILAPPLVIASGAAVRRRVSRIVARPRPPSTAWLTDPEGFSLPSKHTTMAALTAGVCARAAGRNGHAYLAATVAALLVGSSRVYLGVHWPGDVLAGWLFAIGWLRLTEPM